MNLLEGLNYEFFMVEPGGCSVALMCRSPGRNVVAIPRFTVTRIIHMNIR